MTETRKPKVLVTHPWMGKGGSEATALWTLQALCEDFQVTFATAAEADFERWNAVYKTSIQPGSIDFRQAPRFPGVRSETQWAYLQNGLFERYCRGLAPKFDLCVSAYNPVDFGRPGIQLIGDLSFSEKMRLLLYPIEKFNHRQSLLRRLYLSAGDALRGRKRAPLAERGDMAVANSQWIAGLLSAHFGIADAPILYPPVPLPEYDPAKGTSRDPFGFVWLGRISPEKKIESIIEILDRVRAAGYPVSLQIGGHFSGSDYSNRIQSLVHARGDWIKAPGFLDAAEKQALLASQSFSIHANEVEPFGIAVAEMAAAGCLPFVPATGGASEIVTSGELRFEDPDDAAKKIVPLLEHPARAEALRNELAGSVQRFSSDQFVRRLRDLVAEFTGTSLTPSSGDQARGEDRILQPAGR